MAKVKPCEVECNPSTSGGRVGYLVTLAAKVFGIVSKRFERSPSLPSTDGSLEIGDRGVNLPDEKLKRDENDAMSILAVQAFW
ncbi:unnamed protein product [Cylicocyclus nassatus]|uniref:Uncharacterized protein n=1 Tax=Cylicocyclus nassatus TaxID=53992 RepID=A0AA36GMJ3_CYLNA|nr:unnamed protein product [Cylicocyclus nassatus]